MTACDQYRGPEPMINDYRKYPVFPIQDWSGKPSCYTPGCSANCGAAYSCLERRVTGQKGISSAAAGLILLVCAWALYSLLA